MKSVWVQRFSVLPKLKLLFVYFAYFAVHACAAAETNTLSTMEINRAVMVTVELDFGKNIPTIAEALKLVERRYKPDDRRGRTFAILDAYGEPTSNGKLHM